LFPSQNFPTSFNWSLLAIQKLQYPLGKLQQPSQVHTPLSSKSKSEPFLEYGPPNQREKKVTRLFRAVPLALSVRIAVKVTERVHANYTGKASVESAGTREFCKLFAHNESGSLCGGDTSEDSDEDSELHSGLRLPPGLVEREITNVRRVRLGMGARSVLLYPR
jgi:hypothetical protein